MMLSSNVPRVPKAAFEVGIVIIWEIHKRERAESEEDVNVEHR